MNQDGKLDEDDYGLPEAVISQMRRARGIREPVASDTSMGLLGSVLVFVFSAAFLAAMVYGAVRFVHWAW